MGLGEGVSGKGAERKNEFYYFLVSLILFLILNSKYASFLLSEKMIELCSLKEKKDSLKK